MKINEKKRKILLVSPMVDIGPFLPINISVITSLLEKGGYEIRLFDTTFYKIPIRESFKDFAIEIGIFKPVKWDGYNMDDLKEDYISDFKNLIKDFKPDFIGISIFTTFNEKIATSLINAIDDDFKGKVIIGGIHAYINLERVKTYKKVSAIIVGECEDMLLKALDFLYDGETKPGNSIPNLVYRDDKGTWVESNEAKVSDFENIPFLNWDYFDDRNFYRPFDGEVLRMGHVEMTRGCPFRCPYCINEHFNKKFANFWRIKSPKRMLEEITFLKKKYKLEAIKFWDDDFLAMDTKKLLQIASGLKKMKLKFLCHARPEHTTKEKAKLLQGAGCIQIGIGVESGDYEYRRKFLNRRMSNEKIIEAFANCRKYKILSSAYCMIGMPDETRENILATARLLKKAKPNVIVHAIFMPYEGNTLHKYAKDKGYIDKDIDYGEMTRCFLNMPSITAQEVEGLCRTFIFYCRLDDAYYPLIKSAEVDDEIFHELSMTLEKNKQNK